MTNEIKEILDDLDYCKNLRAGNILLKYNECDLLLDYITNLQEEITGLDIALDSGVKNIKEKQQRIDNAIKYINSFCLEKDGYVHYGDDLDPEELVNILRGDE